MPVILEALRSGQVHLAGLRVLAPHLNRPARASRAPPRSGA
jgi:hypothetical protein